MPQPTTTMLKQGSDEWKLARVGSVGASDSPQVMRKTKTGYSADRDSLLTEKIYERLTGKPWPSFVTGPMQQGLDREPIARMTYSIIKGHDVEEAGLVPHPKIKGSHASPDGYVGDKGLIEIKAPEARAHLKLHDTGDINRDHVTQMQWQLAVTGRDWVDYVSFNPDFPLRMQLWTRRIPRDPAYIAEMEREIAKFISELEAKLEKFSRK